jgi:hypothetical protein
MARDPKTGKFRTQNFIDAKDASKELASTIKEMGPILAGMTGAYKDQAKHIGQIRLEAEKKAYLTKDEVKDMNEIAAKQAEQLAAMNEIAPGFASMSSNAGRTASAIDTLLGGMGGLIVAGAAAVKAFLSIQESIAETRKELGVSATQAAIVTAQTKALGFAAKGYGLDVEDIRSAQAAIRNDLGASVQESVKLSLSFARTSAATGQTAEELSSTLSIMESISSASRDVLLNQIRTNAAMIEAAGVAPALVMKDIASNAEFFASYAKDGGQNLINAGVAARKLGLDMSAVSSISESLLNFEESIGAQLEASVLLGRQINLDRARQLALTGDQTGMMEEILRQVGGEAEFNKMNVIQRKALAESVGVSVEQLSRLVRNNTAGGTAGAVGAAVAGGNNVYSDPTTHEHLRKLVRNTEGLG